MKLNALAVFCGASSGNSRHYSEISQQLGIHLSKRQIKLIYGGARVGLMGRLADSVLRKNGHVIGVIPQFLKMKEIVHEELSELFTVQTMHERKQTMCTLSDAFLALPGGFGTLDELFEIITWAQLGLHHKPIALLNVDGYYNFMIQFLHHMVNQGFVQEKHLNLLIIGNTLEEIFTGFDNYLMPDQT